MPSLLFIRKFYNKGNKHQILSTKMFDNKIINGKRETQKGVREMCNLSPGSPVCHKYYFV